MNEMLPAVQSPPTAMVWPINAMDRMALCRELSTARLVPPAFQKSPADLFLVMNTCERFGFDLFLTIGECFVTQGKVGFSGKMAAAMLNSSGRLAERLSYAYAGEGDERTITVTARLQGEAEPRSVTVRYADAKTTNAQWIKQPDQQLGYSGARRWGRLHLPEVMLGMQFDDEVEMIDVTPSPRTERVATVADLPPTAVIEQPAQAQHVEPVTLDAPTGNEEWRPWAANFITKVRGAKTLDELERWIEVNRNALDDMREIEPKMWRMLAHAIEEQREVRKGAATAEAE